MVFQFGEHALENKYQLLNGLARSEVGVTPESPSLAVVPDRQRMEALVLTIPSAHPASACRLIRARADLVRHLARWSAPRARRQAKRLTKLSDRGLSKIRKGKQLLVRYLAYLSHVFEVGRE